MPEKVRTADAIAAQIAGRQHGVVTRAQLLTAGLTPAELEHRMRAGSLIRVHRGVYRVGHRAPSVEAAYLAAVLACGEGALLSGQAAAHLLGLTRGSPPPPEVIARAERRVAGAKVRRCRRMDRRDVAHVRGIPVTTVPRTLVDLAPELSPRELARICHEAGVRYGTTPRHVDAVLARRPRTRGAPKLRRVMRGDTKVTLSRLEEAFLDLLRDAGLPLPETNRPAGGRRVDCRWPEHRLTVELDSYAFHNSRHSWEQDRRREREARAREDAHRRYTWVDVGDEREATLRDVRRLLAAGGGGARR